MDNKEKPLDIYLMGIGGTGMGAFAGLLKQAGHHVFGSDSAIYSPMKEKLADWAISYQTPYSKENIPKKCDLVIVGNVIRKDNEEARFVVENQLPYDSFPSALYKIFLKDAVPLVVSGTHGKTSCSSLLAHTIASAGLDLGFLIGGIPLNFNDSFKAPAHKKSAFVVEGDEYDTAFFDKRPKLIHYAPKLLLITSLEFDHADIYRDLDAVIDAFASVLKTLQPSDVCVINHEDKNIKQALIRSACAAKILTYGAGGDYQATDLMFDERGTHFFVNETHLSIPLFGRHNAKNALGCYALLKQYGLSDEQIQHGFKSFLGVKRRLEEIYSDHDTIVIDDFAHHPTAVRETIIAARQKYPDHKICAVFEPRSATSCMKIFENDFTEALSSADRVLLAPLGRELAGDNRLDTQIIKKNLEARGVYAHAALSYEDLRKEMKRAQGYVLLCMSNGDFKGLFKDLKNIFDKSL